MPPNIQGKKGALYLKDGGVGAVTNFAIRVVNPPAVGNTTIAVTGTTATWSAIEVGRSPKPPASPTRHVLRIRATQLTATKANAAGDTDDITVTVSNTTTPTDKDDADMDGVFGP